jgi:hypothetical protein
MKTIHVTHCSREKDPVLEISGEKVIPERLYTSEGLQRFIHFCKENGHQWAIFSDHYGLVFPHEEIAWYSKPPASVSADEFEVLLDNFIGKLSTFDEIKFYHRADETHPLFGRIITLGRERGMNILEIPEETINNRMNKLI